MKGPVSKVRCPTCAKEVEWKAESRYRPFCSERCQLIDFGEWVNGHHSIPADADYDDTTADDLDRS